MKGINRKVCKADRARDAFYNPVTLVGISLSLHPLETCL